MEAHYTLTNIRATLSFDEVCLSVAICRGSSRIGMLEECSDTGKAITKFRSPCERAHFEEFIHSWWKELDYQSLCSLQIRALIEQDANYALPINEKIRCWVKHLSGPVEKSSAWKWQTRASKQILRSF